MPTLDEYARLWLEDVATRCKPQSHLRYRWTYERDIAPELGGELLSSITRFDVKRLLVRKVGAGAGPGSIGMLVRVLSMIFSQAYDEGLVARHPAQRLKRIFTRGAETPPKAMTSRELQSFLESSKTEPVYEELFRFMAWTGTRLGEARALQVGDLKLSELRVEIRRTFAGGSDRTCSPKTGRARRVEIPKVLARELDGLARGQVSTAWVFRRLAGEALGDWAARAAFRRIRSRAKLPKHFSPHSLRHTYASLLIQQGARAEYVQRQLGHYSIALTVDCYGSWFELSAEKELDHLVESSSKDEEPPRRLKLLRLAPPRPRRAMNSWFNEPDDDDPETSA